MGILGGYWESWNNVVPNIPSSPSNMCIDYVCPEPSNFLLQTQPFTRVYLAFTLLSKNWYSGYDPQNSCGPYNTCGGAACPYCGMDQNVWSDNKIFRILPECRNMGDVGIIFRPGITPTSPTNGLNAYREIGRLLHQSPHGPKEFYISFGGWTDCPVFPTDDAGLEALATMAVDLVLYSFADGIDLDYEHFSIKKTGNDRQDPASRKTQLEAFGKWIVKMHEKFSQIDTQQWNRVISETNQWLDTSPDVSKTGDYYKSNKAYLIDLCQKKPSFGIHYTTRFNAFVASSKNGLGFATDFATDGEGLDLFQNTPGVKDAITGVNLMTYDQAFPSTGASQDKQTVDGYLNYFKSAVYATRQVVSPQTSISIGIETGIQAGDSTALQMESFLDRIGEFAKSQNVGVFFWAINDKQGNQPSAQDLSTIQRILGLTRNPTSSSMSYTKSGNDGWVSNPNLPECGKSPSLSRMGMGMGRGHPTAVGKEAQHTNNNGQTTAAVALSAIGTAAGVSGILLVSTMRGRLQNSKPWLHWASWTCLVVAIGCLIASGVILIVHYQKRKQSAETPNDNRPTFPYRPSGPETPPQMTIAPKKPLGPETPPQMTTVPKKPSEPNTRNDNSPCLQNICLRLQHRD